MSRFAAAKATMRRRIHDHMAIESLYYDTSMAAPMSLRIRWHNSRVEEFGDINNSGFSGVVQTSNRIIFDRDELALTGIAVQRGGKLTIIEPGFNEQILLVDERDPDAGPLEEIWIVSKVPNGGHNP